MADSDVTLSIDSDLSPTHSVPMGVEDRTPLLRPSPTRSPPPLIPSSASLALPASTPVAFHSRFLSPEFLCYYAVLIWAHWLCTPELLAASDGHHRSPQLHTRPLSSSYTLIRFSPPLTCPCPLSPSLSVYNQPQQRLGGLSAGWIPGRLRDNRDYQLRFFRDNLPILTVTLLTFVALSRTIQYLTNNSFYARLTYYAVFSAAFLVFCNGSGVVFMLAIAGANWLIARVWAGQLWCPLLTWIFNASILLSNERYHGYRYQDILGVSYGWLDGYRGMFGWETLFNLVVLRMISHNLDYHWAVSSRMTSPPTAHGISPVPLTFAAHRSTCIDCTRHEASPCTSWREKEAHPLSEYNALTYFVYLFYVPLHFAGPIITFNNFISHLHRSHTVSASTLVLYTLRLLLCMALLEVGLHYLYVFSLPQQSSLLSLPLPAMSALVYFTLNAIWLKFLIIWRFFRLFALLDGIEPVENMVRCVDNNHSVQEFWREWHRSFNRWLLRYIYIPLGGNLGGKGGVWGVVRRVLNVFIVFTWVAYWHDRTLQLLAWGWLISLIFIPELVASTVAKRVGGQGWTYWRHVKAVGASANILMLMIANLVGYGVGLGGTWDVVRMLMGASGGYWVAMFCSFFAAAQIQLEVRRRERWKDGEVRKELGLPSAHRNSVQSKAVD